VPVRVTTKAMEHHNARGSTEVSDVMPNSNDDRETSSRKTRIRSGKVAAGPLALPRRKPMKYTPKIVEAQGLRRSASGCF
jgi:hypothetical protein